MGNPSAGACPPIVTRRDWGAADPLPSTGQAPFQHDDPLEEIYRYVVVHHTAGNPQVDPRDLQSYFLYTRGYSDIGYHFVILANGQIIEGRPLNQVGAHAGVTREQNRGGPGAIKRDPDYYSVGIALAGCFGEALCTGGTLHDGECRDYADLDRCEAHPDWATPEQLASLESLYWYLKELFPKISEANLLMHREVPLFLTREDLHLTPVMGGTTCPGSLLAPVIAELRDEFYNEATR